MVIQHDEQPSSDSREEGSAPERVRDAVIEVACRLFAERGIHAVSVREIAREVGVSHTLLHLYFGNKEEIVRQVLARYDMGFANQIAEADDVAVAAADIFRACGRDPVMVRVVAAALIEGIIPEQIEADADAQNALIARLTKDGYTEAGDLDPRVLSVALGAMVLGWSVGGFWFMSAVGLDQDKDYDEVVDELAVLCHRIMRSCMM